MRKERDDPGKQKSVTFWQGHRDKVAKRQTCASVWYRRKKEGDTKTKTDTDNFEGKQR